MRDLLAPAVLLVVLLLGFGWRFAAKLFIGEPAFRRQRKLRIVELKERRADILKFPPESAIRRGGKVGLDA